MDFSLECLRADFAGEISEPFPLVNFASYTLLMMAEQAVEGGIESWFDPGGRCRLF